MTSLVVKLHFADGLKDKFKLDQEEAIRLFDHFGIQLAFQQAPDMALDASSVTAFQKEICNANSLGFRTCPYSPAPPAAVHFFVCSRFWDFLAEDPLGSIVHRDRGAAAIFLKSAGFSGRTDADLIAAHTTVVCHELGHLLNLVHESGSSMMHPYPLRSFNASVAWSSAGVPRPANMDLRPFSSAARAFLDVGVDVSPWSGPFRDMDGIQHLKFLARGKHRVDLRLEIEPFDLRVGDVLPLSLWIQNPLKQAIRIPTALTPAFDSVRFVVTRPDGTDYVHRPRMSACSIQRTTIPSGQDIVRPLLLYHGPGAYMLPQPGTYRIEALLPWAVHAKCETEFSVSPAASPWRDDMDMARYIASSAMNPTQKLTRTANRIIRRKAATEGTLPGCLALARGRLINEAGRARELLRRAAWSDSPRAVRHRAVLHEAVRWVNNKEQHRVWKDRVRRAFRDEKRDAPLHAAIALLESQPHWLR